MPCSSVRLDTHKYILVKFLRKKDLVLNTEISNKAEIYFDYNPPIITNIASSIIKESVGTIEVKAQEEFVVYPNPSSGTIRVLSLQEGTLRIINTLGNTLKTQTLKKGINTIQCTELKTGAYILTVETGQGTQQSKLIIE